MLIYIFLLYAFLAVNATEAVISLFAIYMTIDLIKRRQLSSCAAIVKFKNFFSITLRQCFLEKKTKQENVGF